MTLPTLEATFTEELPAYGITPHPTTIITPAQAKLESKLPFRGLLKNVRGSLNVAADAGLDWRVNAVPVQYLKSERHDDDGAIIGQDWDTATGYQAIRRSDTGEALAITSDAFQIHQNADILSDMLEIAAVGDASIILAGALNGGRRVVAIAEAKGDFGLPDVTNAQRGLDVTRLYIIITGGHEVGTPLSLWGIAYRLWCMNGCSFTETSTSRIHITHRSKLTSETDRLRRTFESIRYEFESYGTNARRLIATEANDDQNRLYLAELLAPGFARTFAQSAGFGDNGVVLAYDALGNDDATSRRLLSAIDVEVTAKRTGFSRALPRLLDAIKTQTGSNGPNLWSTVNGVTHHVDHAGGRSAETGLDSALFGQGATLKTRALTTALTLVR